MGASMVLLAGDLSYADGFFPRWDTWEALMEPLGEGGPSVASDLDLQLLTAFMFVWHFRTLGS
jgi:hypothetical protein